VIDVNDEPQGCIPPQYLEEGVNPLRKDYRHSGTDTNYPDVLRLSEAMKDIAQFIGFKHKWIPTGKDNLLNLRRPVEETKGFLTRVGRIEPLAHEPAPVAEAAKHGTFGSDQEDATFRISLEKARS
jgi:hypothetical protein